MPRWIEFEGDEQIKHLPFAISPDIVDLEYYVIDNN